MIYSKLYVTALFFTATSNAMMPLSNADFEQPRVPAEAGVTSWTPPVAAGWLFHGGAGLVNTAAPGWSGPRADDGTQAALLPSRDARVTQVLDGAVPGTVYHLRWSEAALGTSLPAAVTVALTNSTSTPAEALAVRALAQHGGWLRKEAVFTAHEPACTLSFAPHPDAAHTPVLIDRIRLWAEPAAPPEGFPRFIVPGHDADMNALRSLFFLHYTSGRILATFNMHWMAESVLWPALESYNGFSQRAWSRQQIITRDISPEGYVSCHQHIGLGHPQGWPFPLWQQGPGIGWHFATHGIDRFAPVNASAATAVTTGITTRACSADEGWHLRIDAPCASIEFPPFCLTRHRGFLFYH